MNYYIDTITWRHIRKPSIDLTDFTDFETCFGLLEGILKNNPRAHITLRVVIEKDDPNLDEILIVQFYYAEPGRLAVSIADEDENLLHQDYLLFLKSDAKIAGTSVSGEDTEESRDQIVKIILDYGMYAVLGVQWALFLLKENQEGTLKQYFDDLFTLEIH